MAQSNEFYLTPLARRPYDLRGPRSQCVPVNFHQGPRLFFRHLSNIFNGLQ